MKNSVKICTSFKDRLIGLMFKNDVDKIYFFPNCNSVHTFFMKFNIDIYMTDKNNNILYVYKDVKPWNIILPKKKVKNIYETKTNLLNLNVNEKMNLK